MLGEVRCTEGEYGLRSEWNVATLGCRGVVCGVASRPSRPVILDGCGSSAVFPFVACWHSREYLLQLMVADGVLRSLSAEWS